MDISEVEEWSNFFPCRQPSRCSISRQQQFVNPELHAALFSVEELLELSPRGNADPKFFFHDSVQVDTTAALAQDADNNAGAALRGPSVFQERSANAQHRAVVQVEQAPFACGNSAPPPGDDGAAGRPLLVRRSPEEYSRGVAVESALTARLRRVNRLDEPWLGAGGNLGDTAGALFTQFDGNQKVKVRVHLPSSGFRGSLVTLSVPAAMRVAELRGQVLRQHGDGKCQAALYELRLYDDDEEEADYDCPPFDENRQVGDLNVQDVALCIAGSSGPRSSSDTEASEGASAEAGWPAHAPALEEADAVTPSLGEVAAASKASSASASLGRGQRCRDGDAARRGAEVLPQHHWDQKEQGAAKGILRVWTSPAGGGDGSEATRRHGPGICFDQTLEQTEHHPTTSFPRVVTSPSAASGSDSSEGIRHRLSHRRTRSTPQASEGFAPLVIFGGFETFAEPAATPSSSTDAVSLVGKQRSQALVPSRSPHGSQGRTLTLLLPNGLVAAAASTAAVPAPTGTRDGVGSSISTPEAITLQVSDDSTLIDVLEQLSQKRHRRFDPVSFSFERLDDGIRQPLDLGMQVRHLHPDACVLTVVRKDARAHVHSPPANAFVPLFNEHTASVTTEYLVTVMVRGTSPAQPFECALIVDRDRLCHQLPKGAAAATGKNDAPLERRGSLEKLWKKLRPHLAVADDASRPKRDMLVERRVRDIQRITCDKTQERSFIVMYVESKARSGSNAGLNVLVELVYEAQTPTECAEIVARLNFLRALVQ